MKNVVITGASGLVATELIYLLLKDEQYRIFAVSTHPDKLNCRYSGRDRVDVLTLGELTSNKDLIIDVFVHCAFARSKNPVDLANSMIYTKKTLEMAESHKVGLFVNISSQSVYGQINTPLWTEQAQPAPDYLYALGKFATELMVETALETTDVKYTNIRLSSVCENARFLNVFVKNALNNQPISVQGGQQNVSFIDVRDVADALKKVIELGVKVNLEKVYNLGTGKRRTIHDLAFDVKRIVEAEKGNLVEVIVQPSDITLDVGMNPTLFEKTFNWKAKYDYEDMIKSLILLNTCKLGGVPVSFKIVYSIS